MPLGGGPQVFVSLVNHLHRRTGLDAQQCTVRSEHRWVFLFAAKAAAGGRLNHIDAPMTEHGCDGLDDIKRALHRADQRKAVVCSGYSDHALGFDVELLLMAHRVGPLNDHTIVSLVAFVDRDLLEDVVGTKNLNGVVLGCEGIEYSRQGFDEHLDVGHSSPCPCGA